MLISTAQGGSREYSFGATGNGNRSSPLGGFTITPAGSDLFLVFQVMSNELNNPKVLLCPAEPDTAKQAASTFQSINVPAGQTPFPTVGQAGGSDGNVSYFVGVDAMDTQPAMFLAGDHNMGDNGVGGGPATPVAGSSPWNGFQYNSGSYPFLGLGTNSVNFGGGNWVAWMNNGHTSQGNVALADGSVQSLSIATLKQALQNTGDTGAAQMWGGNNSSGNCNRLQFP